MKLKEFKDPVHGYISIEEDYCKDFIDTPIFQRLRRIEQTSMRVLYPSAHHDRFIHSLGVFHLGKKLFNCIKNNSQSLFSRLDDKLIEQLRKSFEIACLLHDCGHSPFSHTFEHFFIYKDKKQNEKDSEKINKIHAVFKMHFSTDKMIDEMLYLRASPHEIISAVLVLTHYNEAIKRHNGIPELVARMIMGYQYDSLEFEDRIKNCLIQLLNGYPIDVDKLDYIMRDTWASGVNNVQIDTNRIISSFILFEDPDGKPKICLRKSALSVISNVIIGRNFLYKWIYTHHIVLYEQYLIEQSVNELNKMLTSTDESFISKFFSFEALLNPISFDGKYEFYLPSDDDLFYLFKKFSKESKTINELLSRQFEKKAIWKTYFEFDKCFHGTNQLERKTIEDKATETINKYFHADCCLKIEAKAKMISIMENDIFIYIDNKHIEPYSEKNSSEEIMKYFYFFVNKTVLHDNEIIINELRKSK